MQDEDVHPASLCCAKNQAVLHRVRTGIRKHFHPHREENGYRMSRSVESTPDVPKAEPPHQLIFRFLESFLRSDPYEISLAYMELNRKEIEVAHNEKVGTLYFRFRDQGNLCASLCTSLNQKLFFDTSIRRNFTLYKCKDYNDNSINISRLPAIGLAAYCIGRIF